MNVKRFSLLALLVTSMVRASQPAPVDTLLATVNGKEVTFSMFQNYINTICAANPTYIRSIERHHKRPLQIAFLHYCLVLNVDKLRSVVPEEVVQLVKKLLPEVNDSEAIVIGFYGYIINEFLQKNADAKRILPEIIDDLTRTPATLETLFKDKIQPLDDTHAITLEKHLGYILEAWSLELLRHPRRLYEPSLDHQIIAVDILPYFQEYVFTDFLPIFLPFSLQPDSLALATTIQLPGQ